MFPKRRKQKETKFVMAMPQLANVAVKQSGEKEVENKSPKEDY